MLALRGMNSSAAPLLTDLLKQVSRSFYQSLWLLPRAVRPQISLAYLLARATDTIADTEILPVEERLAALGRLRARIAGGSGGRLEFAALAARQGTPAERALLERIEEALALLDGCAAEDRRLIRAVLETITSGQELDLRRFSGASAKQIVALPTDAELDDYTYRVAGCVGEFWTAMCRAHVFGAPVPDAPDGESFDELAVRFGKGLQLVNILRDLPRDLRQGRCYLPEERLRAAGLAPEDLLQRETMDRFRRLYDSYLDLAREHLEAGWRYTNLIPRSPRVRLACALPILIGARTLALLRTGNALDADQRIKVPRAEVKGLAWRAVLGVFLPPVWRGLFTRAADVKFQDQSSKLKRISKLQS